MILATKAEALICPSCGQRAMTESQKFWLGPMRSRPCVACGTRLSIRWRDVFVSNWPLPIAMIAMPTSQRICIWLLALSEKWLHLPGAVEMVLMIVFGLVVPIGLLMTFLAWGCIRVLDLGPRIGLIVRGAPRADPKAPITR